MFILAGDELQAAVEILALGFLGIASLSEMRVRRFSNWGTHPALVAVAAWRLLDGEWQFLLVWGVWFYFWLQGWYGGGDAKVLMIVTAVWLGWEYLIYLAVGLALIYGLWAFLQKRGHFLVWLQTVPVYAHNDMPVERDKVFVIPVTSVTLVYNFPYSWSLNMLAGLLE